jgi:hypothetical protein
MHSLQILGWLRTHQHAQTPGYLLMASCTRCFDETACLHILQDVSDGKSSKEMAVKQMSNLTSVVEVNCALVLITAMP